MFFLQFHIVCAYSLFPPPKTNFGSRTGYVDRSIVLTIPTELKEIKYILVVPVYLK